MKMYDAEYDADDNENVDQKKLKELLDGGILTQQEFDTQKAKLLNS